MTVPLVEVKVEERFCWIVLNSPSTMNALSMPLLEELEEAVRRVADDPRVRCVILTGEGKAFSAGGDLAGFKSDIDAGRYNRFLARLEYAQDVFNLVESLPVPVIAAVNGVAVAGGLELLLCCDILYAADSARIGDGHAKYGVIPAGGASVRLSTRVSPGWASEMLFSGSLYPAETLREQGLINRVVPEAELGDAVRELARTLCQRSPRGLVVMKQLLRRNRGLPVEQGLRAEIAAFASYAKSEDFREGLAAFAEKRAPVFGGR